MRKHPISTALSNSVLEKIDKEASKQKRSRSEYVEITLKPYSIINPNWKMRSHQEHTLQK